MGVGSRLWEIGVRIFKTTETKIEVSTMQLTVAGEALCTGPRQLPDNAKLASETLSHLCRVNTAWLSPALFIACCVGIR